MLRKTFALVGVLLLALVSVNALSMVNIMTSMRAEVSRSEELLSLSHQVQRESLGGGRSAAELLDLALENRALVEQIRSSIGENTAVARESFALAEGQAQVAEQLLAGMQGGLQDAQAGLGYMQATWPLAWEMLQINRESESRTAAQVGLSELLLEYQEASLQRMQGVKLP